MVNFEKFTQSYARPSATIPYVAIQRSGHISLNRAAYEALGEPEAAELYFDRKDRIVGFVGVGLDVPHSAAIKLHRNGVTYMISGKAFCNKYNIDLSESRRFRAKMYDGGILGIDLNHPETITTREGRGGGRKKREPLTEIGAQQFALSVAD